MKIGRQILWSSVVCSFLGLCLPVGASPLENEDPLAKQVQQLREEVEALRKVRALDSQMTRIEMKLLSERLDQLEQMVGKTSRSTRIAGTIDPTRALIPTATGAIRLDNRLGVRARVTLDGVVHILSPFSTKMVREVPAGTVTYDVTADGFGQSSLKRTSLAGNETLTVTIY